MYSISTGAQTDRGLVRDRNEDSFAVIERELLGLGPAALLVVGDGIGGHLAGDVASNTAVQHIVRSIAAHNVDGTEPDPNRVLKRAVEAANREVMRAAKANSLHGMGTTISCLLIASHQGYLAHVGDSRIYLQRGGRLQQLTMDHRFVEEQVMAGVLTREEAEEHPKRHVITRAVGIDPTVKVDTTNVEIMPGDRFLVCTDGVTLEMSDQEIAQVLAKGRPPEVAAHLVEFANRRGGHDNSTAVVATIDEG